VAPKNEISTGIPDLNLQVDLTRAISSAFTLQEESVFRQSRRSPDLFGRTPNDGRKFVASSVDLVRA
jgi:hypothetical protein